MTGPNGRLLQVGQVLRQESPAQYFVVEASGKLATISPALADLLQTAPGTPGLTEISNAAATMNLSGDAIPDGGLPASLPRVVPQATTLCVVYGAGLQRSLTTGGTVPPGATATAGQAGVSAVWLPRARGAGRGGAQRAAAVHSHRLVPGLRVEALRAAVGLDRHRPWL